MPWDQGIGYGHDRFHQHKETAMANRWQIIKHVGTFAEADVMLDYYQRQSSATEWRIVNHVTA